MTVAWRQYWTLTKPRVVALIVFTALVGMFLAIDGLPDAREVRDGLLGLLGIWLAAASAAAINHVLDARIDALMARTHDRPLPTGGLTARQALVFALALGAASMLLLALFVNVVCAVLTFISLIGYAVVYTGWLKRATPQNIVIGGIAGAAPPLLGWSAITGMTDAWGWAHALILVLIIFVWTPPHFWALALYRIEDYRRSGLPMLPVTHGSDFTRLTMLLYTVMLVVVTMLPYLIGMSGIFYLVSAAALGALFIWYAWHLWRRYSDALARKTFSYSILYLTLLFGALLIDHYL